MCVIEHFEEIYPDGHRQPNTHLCYCEYGSPSDPCDNVQHITVENIFRSLPQAPHSPSAFVEVIDPRRTPRHSRETPREEKTRSLRKFSNNLKLVLNFGNPFKMSNKKKEYTIVERGGKKHLERRSSSRRRRLSPRRTPPPSPRHSGPHVVQVPERREYQHQDPRIIQNHPQQPYDYQVIEPRGERLSRERTRESSSSESPPMTPLRQHRRNHSVSSSGTRHSEDMRRLRAERANRNDREAQDARIRAEREAEAERRRARRYAEREQRRIEHEEHQRLESADRARRRQEREDREALEAAAARQQEERERLERARNVGLTRRPRPGAVVHQRAREGIAERGARVIREAIRAGNERRDQDNQPPRPGAGWERRRDVGGGLRRRDTVAVGQRRVYEDDRRRGGARWI